MAHIERHLVEVTTAADGTATVFSTTITGRVETVHYVKSGSGGFDNGVDFTLTSEATGETIWAEQDVNASATRAPRQPTHSTTGTPSLYASGGSAVNAPIGLAEDRIRIAIAEAPDQPPAPSSPPPAGAPAPPVSVADVAEPTPPARRQRR